MKTCLSIALLLSVYLSVSAQTEPSSLPNIIFIMADDLGYGELGSYGQERIQTPHLDKLAHEGMRFTQHYAGSTVCAPSRCVLLTGLHTGHARVRDNYEMGGFADEEEGGQLPLLQGTFTLGQMLQKQGYRTACVGKWGLGMADSIGAPNRQGFDEFYGYLCQKQAHNYYPTHLWRNDQWDSLGNAYFMPHQRLEAGVDTTHPEAYQAFKGTDYAVDHMGEEARDFVRRNQQEPFFLYFAVPIPHLALQVPDEELAAYAEWEDIPYPGGRGYLPHLRPRAAYAAMISRMDREVGKLMALLNELGIDEETLVIFSSDNGATIPGVGGVDTRFFDSYAGLRGWKTNLYEGGIRVPMIARWPGKVAEGSSSGHLSAFWDILPTLAEISGSETPQKLDGISLLPTLLNKGEQAQHEALYWEYHSYNSSQAVRMGKWKGIRQELRKNPDAALELYDLEVDPAESQNIADQHPDIVEKILAIMEQSHETSEIEGWNFEPK